VEEDDIKYKKRETIAFPFFKKLIILLLFVKLAIDYFSITNFDTRGLMKSHFRRFKRN
jgi:hypothetical protein